VRPTQDRLREALFAVLGKRVEGSRFLDLFAGSGAVGLEAWSRGAELVCWVEWDRAVVSVLKENVEQLCGTEGRVVKADAIGFLRRRRQPERFDVIFADPPYRETRRSVRGDAVGQTDLPRAVLRAACGKALAEGGLIIVEQSSEECVPEHQGWELADDREYGSSRLRFFLREQVSRA